MKRNESQLHSDRARVSEDLEEAKERLNAELAAQVPDLGHRLGFVKETAMYCFKRPGGTHGCPACVVSEPVHEVWVLRGC